MKSERRAFSLIELLVVMAVLALLVTILLPTFVRARELARRAVCAAGQRDMGRAFAAWAEGSNGRLPKGLVNIEGGCWGNRAFWASEHPDEQDNYDDLQGFARGECALARRGWIAPEQLYCPSWSHPWMQLRVIQPGKPNMSGYFPEDEGIAMGIKRMHGSYHYRATFRERNPAEIRRRKEAKLWRDHWPYRPASMKIEPASKTAILVDKFIDGDVVIHHGDAYVVLYLDGHVNVLSDKRGTLRDWNSGYDYSTDYGLQEFIFRDFFDEK